MSGEYRSDFPNMCGGILFFGFQVEVEVLCRKHAELCHPSVFELFMPFLSNNPKLLKIVQTELFLNGEISNEMHKKLEMKCIKKLAGPHSPSPSKI